MPAKLATNPSWDSFRANMPIVQRWAYFDHAAVAPLSGPAQQEISRWTAEAAEQGDTVWFNWAARIEQVRALAAELVNALPTEIALVPNTTAGINYVADGFLWQAGDNVVTISGEFPSNIYPWANLADRGVEERRFAPAAAEIDFDQLFDSCDAKTRMIAISWVGYATGWRIDVDKLVERAHARGILVFLDAIQGLGVFPLDVRATGVDFLAADGHKWMLGPEGAGVFFVQHEHLNLLRPMNIGWNSVTQGGDFTNLDFNLRDDAARYEGGSQNMIGFHALGASLELLRDHGLAATESKIATRILETTACIAERLESIGAQVVSPLGQPYGSGIISFELPNREPQQVKRKCLADHVVINQRAGRIRISPHAYTNEDDINRLIDSLKSA